MRFRIEDKEYEYNGKITVEDAMFIFDKSGVGVAGLNRAIAGDGSSSGDGNPYAIAAWAFLLKRRAGEAVRWEDMLKLDITQYNLIPDQPSVTKQEAAGSEETPDPTSANGRTRRRGSTRTS